jgi:hypothetical protein
LKIKMEIITWVMSAWLILVYALVSIRVLYYEREARQIYKGGKPNRIIVWSPSLNHFGL